MEKFWFNILKIICFSFAVYIFIYILFSWSFTDFVKDSRWILLFLFFCLNLLIFMWILIGSIEEAYYDHIRPWVNFCFELFETIMHEFFLFLELFCIYLDYFIIRVFEFSASYPLETFLIIVLIRTSTWLFMLLVTFLEQQYYKYKNK
jgi:hypothetical protein